jgi:hypothetical protein
MNQQQTEELEGQLKNLYGGNFDNETRKKLGKPLSFNS